MQICWYGLATGNWRLAATMQFMTREVFDALIIVVIVVGLIAAARRLRQDFTRPLPTMPDDDTQPTHPVKR